MPENFQEAAQDADQVRRSFGANLGVVLVDKPLGVKEAKNYLFFLLAWVRAFFFCIGALFRGKGGPPVLE